VTSEVAASGPRKNFLGSLSLAIFSGPLKNYAIIRPLDSTSCAVVGKIKSTVLLEVLSSKARDWTARHHPDDMSLNGCDEGLEGGGLYVFKHRDKQCFQLVGRADNVFARCSELLKAAFDGTTSDPLSALLVISLASDWDFYFIPVHATGR